MFTVSPVSISNELGAIKDPWIKPKYQVFFAWWSAYLRSWWECRKNIYRQWAFSDLINTSRLPSEMTHCRMSCLVFRYTFGAPVPGKAALSLCREPDIRGGFAADDDGDDGDDTQAICLKQLVEV